MRSLHRIRQMSVARLRASSRHCCWSVPLLAGLRRHQRPVASDLRFVKGEMRVVLERQSEAVTMGVRSLDPDLVLNTPVEDLVDRLYEKYRVEPVVLDLDHRRSSGATDVSLPFESWSGRTAEVEGTRVEVLLPFSGDGVLLDVRASTFDMNPPRFDEG